MKIKITFISILIFFCYSCKHTRNEDKVTTGIERSRPINELEYLVFEKGDTNAYIELDIAYLDMKHGEFLKFAKVMADKYDYTQAYFDVYFQTLKHTLRKGTRLSLDSCTLVERNLAIITACKR
jgi:hypothetical protein